MRISIDNVCGRNSYFLKDEESGLAFYSHRYGDYHLEDYNNSRYFTREELSQLYEEIKEGGGDIVTIYEESAVFPDMGWNDWWVNAEKLLAILDKFFRLESVLE